MSQRTKIEWTEETANPFPGCRKVSEGCMRCYAERMAKRLKAMGQAKYQRVIGPDGKWTGKIGRDPSCMVIPGTGKTVFVNSMGDLGYEGINQFEFDQAVEWIRLQWQHTFQVLTKRPVQLAAKLATFREKYPDNKVNRDLKNLWLGVTVENQDYDWRITKLLQIPAAVRFVSLEPLLGPIDLNHVNRKLSDASAVCGTVLGSDGTRFSPGGAKGVGVDWVVVGCETGPKRRPCNSRWVTSIIDQCHAVGVPVFVKAVAHALTGKIIDKADEIADYLGYSVEQIRQFPARSSK